MNFKIQLRKKLSYLLLPVMILFSFQSAFGETGDWRPQTVEYSTRYAASSTRHPELNIDENPFRFSSSYFDSESGLYYLNARYYSAELMRFINRDSYDLSNRYGYCDGDPVDNADPSGHSPIGAIGNLVAAGFVAFAASFIPVCGSVAMQAGMKLLFETLSGAVGGGAGEFVQQSFSENKYNIGNIVAQAGLGAIAGLIGGGIAARRILKSAGNVGAYAVDGGEAGIEMVDSPKPSILLEADAATREKFVCSTSGCDPLTDDWLTDSRRIQYGRCTEAELAEYSSAYYDKDRNECLLLSLPGNRYANCTEQSLYNVMFLRDRGISMDDMYPVDCGRGHTALAVLFERKTWIIDSWSGHGVMSLTGAENLYGVDPEKDDITDRFFRLAYAEKDISGAGRVAPGVFEF